MNTARLRVGMWILLAAMPRPHIILPRITPSVRLIKPIVHMIKPAGHMIKAAALGVEPTAHMIKAAALGVAPTMRAMMSSSDTSKVGARLSRPR